MNIFLTMLFNFIMIASIVGQTSIKGKVNDRHTGEEMIAASISIFIGDSLITKLATDFDGNYNINITPGVYNFEVTYPSYVPNRIKEVLIPKNKSKQLDIKIVHIRDRFKKESVAHILAFTQRDTDDCSCSCGSIITGADIKKFVSKSIISINPLLQNTVSYYPNPATNKLNIQLKQEVDFLIIRNITGIEVLKNNNLLTEHTAIDISDLTAGTYILQFITGNRMISKKLIIVKP